MRSSLPPESDLKPSASLLLSTLLDLDVTDALGLPDNTSAALFALLKGEPHVRLLTVTREAEAFAIASGLWVGGRSPVIIMQNTGLLESGDALRGTAVRMGVPLLCLITYRGYASLHAQQHHPGVIRSRDDLVRPDLDSTAVVLEPTLASWGIPFFLYGQDGDASRIPEALAQAQSERRPVALLITRELR